MIHPGLLSRLCQSRDLLRDWEDGPLPVSVVARRCGLTPFHFIRLFKAVFGETPQRYRSRAQLEKAKHLLVVTDLSVTAICFEVGFSSLGSFSALFSRTVGTSPSEFRRLHQSAAAPEPHLPATLVPGCLSLMAGLPEEKQFSRRQSTQTTGSVGL